MKKEMKVNPEEGKKVKIDVQGYGCDDDCEQEFQRASSTDGCGWRETDNTCPLW